MQIRLMVIALKGLAFLSLEPEWVFRRTFKTQTTLPAPRLGSWARIHAKAGHVVN